MITEILKKCGRGILYIFTLPVLLVVLSVYAVIGVVQFFVVGIKSIIYYFTGRNLFGEFPEDIKAREILEGKDVTNINIAQEPPKPIVENKEQPYITAPDKQVDEPAGVEIYSEEDHKQ